MANTRPFLNPIRIFFTKSFSRFGLRTLLMAVAVCATFLGYWNWKYAPVARAINRLASEDLFVEYDEEFTEELSAFESWMYSISGITTPPSCVTHITGQTPVGLDGFEYFPNLKFINLNGPNLSDLRPLARLTRLTSLDLVSDQIVDLSPLKDLTGLQQLSISSQGLTDITPLAQCLNLEYLELVDTNVTDISALKSLSEIINLNLTGSPVKDIQALSSLENLVGVNVSKTSVESLLPLENLIGVSWLFIDGSPVKSLRGIENLVQLTELDLTDTLVSDLQPLEHLRNLSGLKIINTQVENLETLPRLPAIKRLEIGGEQLKSLSGLANAMPNAIRTSNDGIDIDPFVPRGVDITLENCPITDLRELGEVVPLAGFTLRSIPATQLPEFKGQDISTASIIDVPIADFSPIENQPLDDLTIESPSAHFDSSFLERLKCLDTLSHLTINDAEIGDLSILSPMKSLYLLDLKNCDLSNFEALSNLIDLEDLTLDDTDLRDIEWIRKLELLTDLSIANTRVSDVSPTAELNNLYTLNLSGCPVSNLDSLNPSISELLLNRTDVRDLMFLRRLSELDRLQICDTDVSDLTPLVETQRPSQLLKMAGVCLDDPDSIEKLNWISALDVSGTNITNSNAFASYSGLSYLVVEDVNLDMEALKRNLPSCEILLKRTEDDWYPFTWAGGSCCF